MPCQEIKKLKKLFFLNETWIAVNTEKMAVCAGADVSYSPLYIICDVKKTIASLFVIAFVNISTISVSSIHNLMC